MKAVIKESFTKAELSSGDLLVTPKTFHLVKFWSKYEVSGLKYYVDKAVNLGGKRPKPKKKKEE